MAAQHLFHLFHAPPAASRRRTGTPQDGHGGEKRHKDNTFQASAQQEAAANPRRHVPQRLSPRPAPPRKPLRTGAAAAAHWKARRGAPESRPRRTAAKFPSTWTKISKYLEKYFQVLGNIFRARTPKTSSALPQNPRRTAARLPARHARKARAERKEARGGGAEGAGEGKRGGATLTEWRGSKPFCQHPRKWNTICSGKGETQRPPRRRAGHPPRCRGAPAAAKERRNRQ